MEAKKSSTVDVYKKLWLFRSIGLMISLSLMVTAFEWKSYDRTEVDLQSKKANTFIETIDIPPTEQLPPPPVPQISQAQIIEVADEEEIKEEVKVNLDIEVTTESRVEQITIMTPAPEEEETDKIFTVVEETASPKGGMVSFYQYIKDNINYPAQARRMNIQGRVYVEFVIDKNGSLTDVKVVKGIGAGCDEEAVRIVQAAPPWNPGKQRGKPVRQRYTLPIIFKMGNI